MGTTKTEALLETAFADNSIGAITASDGRDLINSAFVFVNTRNPGANDDRVNTSGAGGFFDTGNRWYNANAKTWWKCRDGTPGAAVWSRFLLDGEAAGGRLSGTLPDPLLAASGVAPGAYGDASHYATFTVSADGTLSTAAAFALPSSTPTVVTGSSPRVVVTFDGMHTYNVDLGSVPVSFLVGPGTISPSLLPAGTVRDEEDNIAAVGTTQGTAYALSKSSNRVTSSSAGNNGVILFSGTASMIVIECDQTNAFLTSVYAPVGEYMNGVLNGVVTQGPGTTHLYVNIGSRWYVI